MSEIHISILGEKEIPKLDLIKYYLQANNINEIKPKAGRLAFMINSTKVKVYEYSEIQDIKSKDIINNQCIIIIFDMTKRKSFMDVLDKWIKFLREVKYNKKIILFGTGNKDALTMTDEQECTYLIEITGIQGEFYDLRNMEKPLICKLIDKLIEKVFEYAKNNVNKKDCNIF